MSMASEARTYKLIEQSEIGPAIPPHPNSSTLPLTFLDISLAGPIYVKRQFFYHFPYSINHFLHTTLPSLKRSLSLTLQLFFPLAGNLHCPPPPRHPFIHCAAPDSVTLTVLHSHSQHDFKHLSSNYLKSLKDLDYLVPKLSCSSILEDDVVHATDDNITLVFPILALQVTVFPNQGLCIAITYCHVIDDRTCSHFMKSWASICASGGDTSFVEKSPPCYDREVVKDPKGLEAIFLRDYFEERSRWIKDSVVVSDHDDFYKATLVLRGKDIEGLRKWVINEWNKNEESNAPKYLSKFVVTCGFVWASFVKTRYRNEDEDEKDEYFTFAADCRNRLEYSIPENYFGNCITRCHVTLKRKEVKGDEGFLKAVKVIERAIQDMKKDPFEDAENWNEKFVKMFVLGSIVLVTGSPKFGVYDTDFGFGRPTKVEMVHSFKGMSLAERGHEEGGLEVGLIFRNREQYDYFISDFKRKLLAFKS